MKDIFDVKKYSSQTQKSTHSFRDTISKSRSNNKQRFYLKKEYNSQRKLINKSQKICNFTTIVEQKNIVGSNTFYNIWKNFQVKQCKQEKKTKKKQKENCTMSKNPKNFYSVFQKIKNQSIQKQQNLYKKQSIKTIQNFQSKNKSIKERKTKVKKLNLKKFQTKDFEVLKHLGKGKFGEVYLVKEIKRGFKVALKVINKNIIQRYKAEKQIVREIAIHQRLSHKNITKLICRIGQSLRVIEKASILKSQIENLLNNKFLKQFDKQHRNIIHRDIKPENILINKDIYKIADFGWSSLCNQKRETFCGTVDYLAPEVVNSLQQDLKIDNWAVGILTFELLVGKTPYGNKSHFEVMQDIKSCNIQYPDFLSSIAKDFISKLLIKESQFRMDLIDVLQHPFLLQNSI